MFYDVSSEPDVRDAIERLYAVFARYPLRQHLHGCPHCFSAVEDRGLHAYPLRQMPEENLTMFSWKTMSTWGDAKDFKHFFPRLCELSVSSDDTLHFGMALYHRKVRYERAGYASWPEDKRAAFAGFLLAWWRALLERGKTVRDLDVRLLFAHDVETSLSLEQLATYVEDLRPFLAALLEVATLGGRAYVLATYCLLYWRGETPTSYFSADQVRQITEWLTEPATMEHMRDMAEQLAMETAGQEELLVDPVGWPTSLPMLAADVLAILG
jgi:hypothetical protein